MSPTQQASRGAGSARRREARARRTAVTAGLVAILVALILLVVAYRSPTGIPLKPYYNVTAQFRQLGTLEETANVTIRGRLVGQVVDLRLVRGVPTVDLQMVPGTKRLPIDSTARIRPRGLLGEEYIDITPGASARTITNGGMLPADQTSSSEQLTDVFAGLTPSARTHLQQMINGLGEGFLGRGQQLNGSLATAPSTFDNLVSGLTPVIDSGATPGLIANANTLTAELDAVTADFYPGMHFGAISLSPLVTEAPSVSRLLEEAPSDLPSIQSSLASADTKLAHLSRFSEQATEFTAYAPRALRSLTAVLTRGRQPLRSARTLLQTLQPAIAPTLRATSALDPELPYLSSFFDVTSPVLNALAPWGCDFDAFANDWRGFLSVGVRGQNGPLGPYTTLRLGVAGPGFELASTAPEQTVYNPNPPAACGIAPGS